ncbi:hypothetical protein [Agrobacterium radiobacter]|uniref:hypothetical protein n=1 Tax=Agrobacterium radiobacter TaxID=362 RepID=UPI003F8696FA
MSKRYEPVWVQNIKGLLRGVPLTDEMKAACLKEFEVFCASKHPASAEGWKLVPTEPTGEMMRAMFEAMFEATFDGTAAPMIGAGYDAALAAAPTKEAG